MNVSATLDDLKKRHRELYNALLDKQTETGESTESPRPDFVQDIDALLKDVQRLSPDISSPSDYTWLINATLQWQIALSTLLETPWPRAIKIPDPPKQVSVPQVRSSDDDVQAWIKSNAEWISVVRRAKAAESLLVRLSTKTEEHADWYQAEVFFCEKVLSGEYNFVAKVPYSSFYHLENVYLRDVLQVKAYLLWEHKKHKQPQNEQTARANYLDACEFYRQKLADQNIKADAIEFSYLQSYLTETYFRESPSILDEAKILPLIQNKAKMYIQEHRSAGDTQNWLDAERFVTGFYGNIIGAVIYGDEGSKIGIREAILRSEGRRSRLSIMSAFEAAIVIYFLKGFDAFADDWKQ